MIVNGVEKMDIIKIKNAYENNLKHITLDIPINQWTCFIGPSGSGKSSLVYDTLFAECQREFLESMVSNQYGFKMLEKPKVDAIIHMKPALDLSQKYYNTNPRSTVGTFTDLSYYFRSLFSLYILIKYQVMVEPALFSPNNTKSVCPRCKGTGMKYCIDFNKLIPDKDMSLIRGGITFFGGSRDSIAAKKLEALCEFFGIDITKSINELSQKELEELLYGKIETPIELSYKTPKGRRKKERHIVMGAVEELNILLEDVETPSTFLSIEKYLGEEPCDCCNGSGLNSYILKYTINGNTIYDYESMPVSFLKHHLIDLATEYSRNELAEQINSFTKSIVDKINALIDLKIGYLSLSRKIPSLSGGECQRVRLSKQLGSSLTGLLYILDEPCKGLHYKDIDSIIQATKTLVEKGNTVVSIEHNVPFVLAADKIIEMGPCGGPKGGYVINDNVPKVSNQEKYLTKVGKTDEWKYFEVHDITKYNLVNLDVKFPIGKITTITGQSGVGKTTLASAIYDAAINDSQKKYFKYTYLVNQKPIGKNPRSTLVSYLGIYENIRTLLANTETAKKNKIKSTDFSMNAGNGRCENCNGLGRIRIELPYMEDAFCTCPICDGRRFKPEVLSVEYNGKNIADILDESIDDIKLIFKDQPTISHMLDFLIDIGLGYLKLGQLSMSLSGGEAQRIKIAKFLANKQSGCLFILDEPTAGLHSIDKALVANMVNRLCDQGNTCLLIEHDFNVICKLSDYMIDMIINDEEDIKLVQGSIDKVINNEQSSWYDLYLSSIK